MRFKVNNNVAHSLILSPDSDYTMGSGLEVDLFGSDFLCLETAVTV
jgi:hypothetical protein